MKIKKAVIPAAGLGTRMLPITHYLPKELLPIGNVAMIEFALDEALAAGAEEIFVVINNKEKWMIKDYLNKCAAEDPREDSLEAGHRNQREKCQLIFIDQEEPLGLVDALQKVKRLLENEPFYLLLPDNVYFGEPASTSRLLECYSEYKQNILGLIEVTKGQAALFGNCGKVEIQSVKNNFFVIKHLQDKAPGTFELSGSEKAIRSCGRYILGPEFFYEAERIQTSGSLELDDVPILQNLVQKKKMMGVILEGKLFDCGHWEGYWAATRYWLENRGKWN